MPDSSFILITFAVFVVIFLRTVHQNNRSFGLASWEKMTGLLAVVLALLVVLTPEFAALGLIGDSAFFDLLVLLMSLQIQSIATVIRSVLINSLRRVMVWFFAPRVSYLIWLSAYGAVLAVVGHVQRLVHRIWS